MQASLVIIVSQKNQKNQKNQLKKLKNLKAKNKNKKYLQRNHNRDLKINKNKVAKKEMVRECLQALLPKL